MASDRIVFGTMSAFGTFNGLYRHPVPMARARALLAAAHGLGIRTLDTAPIYCRGLAEQRIGDLAASDFQIWTKVGVSIHRPLPQVDFSFDQLSSGLQHSLRRLQRDTVEVVFLHNPDSFPKRSIEVDRFSSWVKGSGLSTSVGISVLGSQIPERFLQCDDLDVVMIERKHLPALIARHRNWLLRRKVVVRSIFAGGSVLRTVPIRNRTAFIAQALRDVDQLWPVWRYVIAPRTLKQASDYRSVIED